MDSATQKPFSVSELTDVIKETLEGSVGEVWVEGEISNFRRQSSGHLYFTLKDAGAQLSVVMFRSSAERLGFEPKDGQHIVARGDITVYPPRGNYQLRAVALQPKGRGALQEQFEALKRKLAAEGLFDSERKKSIPIFPERVGVITSPTGAALRDFLQILSRRCPRIHIQVFGVKVQGEGAAQEIVRALEVLNQRNEADVIVLARGGGSLEDLWSFNEEIVARAVAASCLPTISGVGHEIDFTLCDFAADLRAPTPSAAAELLSRSDEDWRDEIATLRGDLLRNTRDYLEEWKQTWRRLTESYVFREPRRVVEEWQQKADDLRSSLALSVKNGLDWNQERWGALFKRWQLASPEMIFAERRKFLSGQAAQLRLLSPQATLERGYAMVLDEKRNILKTRADAVTAGDVNVRFADGETPMKVIL
ncbi:MAG: exodeoxyribonuclease VII large subunit [bacterium]